MVNGSTARGPRWAEATAGALMFGFATTEPHFRWAIESDHDIVLLMVLLVASLAASEFGAHRRVRRLDTHAH
jgi:K+-sensing histidine kinase KdpD